MPLRPLEPLPDSRGPAPGGFLRYRSRLHAAGLVDGFQWLDGSFLEEIERLEARPPQDIDVVSFVDGAAGLIIEGENARLFNRGAVKHEFHVDHYLVELTLPVEDLVTQAAYWFSLWSHRRTRLWKGYLEIDLNPSEDAAARALLALPAFQEVHP